MALFPSQQKRRKRKVFLIEEGKQTETSGEKSEKVVKRRIRMMCFAVLGHN
jgi:hypothetical protein